MKLFGVLTFFSILVFPLMLFALEIPDTEDNSQPLPETPLLCFSGPDKNVSFENVPEELVLLRPADITVFYREYQIGRGHVTDKTCNLSYGSNRLENLLKDIRYYGDKNRLI